MAQARIVVAEDESLEAELIRENLVGLGYDVLSVVASGEEVVSEVGEKQPDLVLVDIGLAGEMDGVEAAEQIRTHFDIPVVFLTAYADETTLQRAKVSGPFGYVLKPFSKDALHTTIQTALQEHQMVQKLRESEQWYRALFDQSQHALLLENQQQEILDANQAASRLFGYPRQELLAMKTSALELPGIRSQASLPAPSTQSLGEGQQIETEILDRDEKRIPVEITVTPLRVGGQTLLLSSVRDITARRQAEQALHAFAERLQILREIDQSILAARLPETIAVAAINRIRRLIPCQRTVVVAVGEGGQAKLLAAESSSEMEPLADVSVYQGLFQERILNEGWIQGTEDLDELVEQTPLQKALHGVGIRSHAVIPLHIGGELVGALSLECIQPRAFRFNHIDIAIEVATSLAVAISQAKLAEKAQEAAVTAERGRLARDLHDAVTQTLFSATLIAEALPQVWERQPEEGRKGLEEIRQLTRGALAELRTLLVELRPAALTERPLGDLLRHLVEAASGRIRVPVALRVDGDASLPPRVQIALYRICQEALNNVAKHADAKHVAVELDFDPGRVTLGIRDDGKGFHLSDVLPDRMGLGILQERAAEIGARCEILSQPGQGTQVVVHWRESGGR